MMQPKPITVSTLIATAFTTRFWAKVHKTAGCWLWTGCIVGGYGYIGHEQRSLRAHRVSWILAQGTDVPDGLLVLHNCPGGDNPACVRPDHLYIGTNAQNTADMIVKGRNQTGDQHWSRRQPEKRPYGLRAGVYTHPDSRPRGERHGSHTHPESVVRGDAHYSRRQPERVLRGEGHGMARLTEQNVRAIRARHADGASGVALAAAFGVTPSMILRIVHRKAWTHIP